MLYDKNCQHKIKNFNTFPVEISFILNLRKVTKIVKCNKNCILNLKHNIIKNKCIRFIYSFFLFLNSNGFLSCGIINLKVLFGFTDSLYFEKKVPDLFASICYLLFMNFSAAFRTNRASSIASSASDSV